MSFQGMETRYRAPRKRRMVPTCAASYTMERALSASLIAVPDAVLSPRPPVLEPSPSIERSAATGTLCKSRPFLSDHDGSKMGEKRGFCHLVGMRAARGVAP